MLFSVCIKTQYDLDWEEIGREDLVVYEFQSMGMHAYNCTAVLVTLLLQAVKKYVLEVSRTIPKHLHVHVQNDTPSGFHGFRVSSFFSVFFHFFAHTVLIFATDWSIFAASVLATNPPPPPGLIVFTFTELTFNPPPPPSWVHCCVHADNG